MSVKGGVLMILTKDQDPRRVIEELRDERFICGGEAIGELNDVLIENGIPLFFMSFFGTLTTIKPGSGGVLPEKVNFKLSISDSDGWYEISEVKITTTANEVIIEETENTEFIPTTPECP